MSFLDFWNAHYKSMSFLLAVVAIVVVVTVIFLFKKLNNRNIKTPWFEIAPDSIKKPETEEMGKTRLLIKRQSDYLDKFMDGIQPVFLALIKEVTEDAMKTLFKNSNPPKTHMMTCLIQSSTNELVKELKYYINNLLVVNHIGADKEKITKYAKGHVTPLIGIAKKSCCDLYSSLSGQICTSTEKYWSKINIENPRGWAEDQLIKLLLDLSDLRYSDFNSK